MSRDWHYNVLAHCAQVVNELPCVLVSCSPDLGLGQYLMESLLKVYFSASNLINTKTFSVIFSLWLPASVLRRNFNPIHC